MNRSLRSRALITIGLMLSMLPFPSAQAAAGRLSPSEPPVISEPAVQLQGALPPEAVRLLPPGARGPSRYVTQSDPGQLRPNPDRARPALSEQAKQELTQPSSVQPELERLLHGRSTGRTDVEQVRAEIAAQLRTNKTAEPEVATVRVPASAAAPGPERQKDLFRYTATDPPAPVYKAPAVAAEAVGTAARPRPAEPREADVKPVVVNERPHATMNGYTLSLSKSVLSPGEASAIVATLTNGAGPVSGAAITLNNGSIGPFVTDAAGSATLSFTAPPYNAQYNIWVTVDTYTDMFMGEIFTLNTGYGALIIDQVTDFNNNPVTSFSAGIYYYYPGGGYTTSSRYADAGYLSIIKPAGTNYVELSANFYGVTAESMFLYQSVTLPDKGIISIHPSGTGTIPLSVAATLDGSPLSGRVLLHSNALPGDSYGNFRLEPSSVHVTPGAYAVEYLADTPTDQLLFEAQQVDALAGSYTFTVATSELATLDLIPQSGLSYDYMRLDTPGFMTGLPPTDMRVLAAPDFNFRLTHYQGSLGGYEYSFGNWDDPYVTPAAASLYPLNLGGPVTGTIAPTQTTFPAGSPAGFDVSVRTDSGDVLEAYDADWNPLHATVSLQDSSGAVIETYTVEVRPEHIVFNLPAGATGTYTVTYRADTGSYQGLVEGTYSFTADGAMAAPDLTLSEEILYPNTDVTVVATVMDGTNPVMGATVSVPGYTSATTDTNGQATLAFRTGSKRQRLNVTVDTPTYFGTAGYLYVVPDGFGVLELESVTDITGARVMELSAEAAYVDANGSWGWSTQTNLGGGTFIQPVGTNFVTVAANSNGFGYYLTGQATVLNRQKVYTSLDATGTVLLQTSASLDGVALNGGVLLHNQALPYDHWRLLETWPNNYVTPGHYLVNYHATANGETLLLNGSVDATAPAALDLSTTRAALATVPSAGLAGDNVSPLQFDWVRLMLPGTAVELHPDPINMAVTPNMTYRLENFGKSLSVGADQWDYLFQRWGPFTPPSGGTVYLNLGGAMTATVAPDSAQYAASQEAMVHTRLSTAYHDWLQIQVNGNTPYGALRLWDSAGNLLSAQDFPLWQEDHSVTMPSTPGTYTLTVDYETGPWQGTVHAETSVTVQNHAALAITVEPKIIRPYTATPVTIQVTDNGVPAANTSVDVGWYGDYGTVTTDANGMATLTVQPYWAEAIPVMVSGSNQVSTYLFAIYPDMSGLELSARNENGSPIANFWGFAETSLDLTYDWTEAGKIGMVLEAGPTTVEALAEGNPAYFLSGQFDLAPDQVSTVELDARQASPVYVAPTLDGSAVTGSVAMRNMETWHSVWLAGLFLDDSGTGTAYVTPATYDLFLQGKTSLGQDLLAFRSTVALPADDVPLALTSQELGQMEFHLTGPGGDLPMQLSVQRSSFFFDLLPTQPVLATRGTYLTFSLYFELQQPDGHTWGYNLYRENPIRIGVMPGSYQNFTWDAGVRGAVTQLDPAQYRPGYDLWYRQQVSTADNWQYGYIRNTSAWNYVQTLTSVVTDADGMEQDRFTSNWPSSWDYFPVPWNPSAAYTVTQTRNLGLMGTFQSAATATLKAPFQVAVNREILAVGQQNPLTITVTQNGLPVKDTWVDIWGAGADERAGHTNAQGQVTFQVRPGRMGTLFIFTESTVDAVYALAPGFGLLDVTATSQTGAPLEDFSFMAESGGNGWHWGNENRKAIVPAGHTGIAVIGAGADANYYLTAAADVPSMGSVTVVADGAATVPLPITVWNTGTSGHQDIYLRNQALDYTETEWLPYGLETGAPTYVTPGNYDVMVRQSGDGALRLLTGSVTADGASALTLDALAATAELQIEGLDSHGIPMADMEMELQYGGIGLWIDPAYYGQILATPGQYRSRGATLWASSGSLDWQFEFQGDVTYQLEDGMVQPIVYGGPLTGQIGLAQPVYGAGDVVWLSTEAIDKAGHSLAGGLVIDVFAWTVTPLTNQLQFTGNGIDTTFHYSGSYVGLRTPTRPGAYTLTYSFTPNSYFEFPAARATLQLVTIPLP